MNRLGHTKRLPDDKFNGRNYRWKERGERKSQQITSNSMKNITSKKMCRRPENMEDLQVSRTPDDGDDNDDFPTSCFT